MTVFIQILTEDKLPTPGRWTPWKNSKSVEETVKLAIHQWMRLSGYMHKPVSFASFPLFIFSFDETCPMNKAGDQPLTCHREEYMVHPTV